MNRYLWMGQECTQRTQASMQQSCPERKTRRKWKHHKIEGQDRCQGLRSGARTGLWPYLCLHHQNHNSSYAPFYHCSRELGTASSQCSRSLPTRYPQQRNLHGGTRRDQIKGMRGLVLETTEGAIWLEAGRTAMEKVTWRDHARTRI